MLFRSTHTHTPYIHTHTTHTYTQVHAPQHPVYTTTEHIEMLIKLCCMKVNEGPDLVSQYTHTKRASVIFRRGAINRGTNDIQKPENAVITTMGALCHVTHCAKLNHPVGYIL